MTETTNKKKSILLRIDPELWNELNQWANDELRSLNGQIEFILRESVRRRRKGKLKSENGGEIQ
ncbi:MAG: Arc family DNA-binding protein [Candidatus Latescibacteria bacterium]|nr:Arc family DNA-binding protein [Candidatus Latescibacterota bacterium]